MRAAVLLVALLAAGCAQIAQAPLTGPSPAPPATVDLVLIDKSDRTLTLYSASRSISRFTGLQYGDAPQGHKQFEGDERTPEGRYTIDNRNPRSAYHLSLHISYPNAADRAFAEGQGRSAGGEIFIHGQPNALADADRGARIAGDWTDGCIALSNREIEALWQLVADGTPIEIRP